MEAKDVKKLPWKQVTDWSALSATNENWKGEHFVCETDVNVFVENVYRDISRQLNIPYEQLQPILVAENAPFNSLKAHLFKVYTGYGRKNTNLIKLEGSLRIPDISKAENDVATDNVSVCMKMFKGLSDIEKMLFLEKIGKISVKIEHYAVQAEDVAVK